jgi:hypothetical protein
MNPTYPGLPQLPLPQYAIPAPSPNVQNISVMTSQDLKNNFLYGIPLKNSLGQTVTDDSMRFMIDAATTWLENELQVTIKKKAFSQERHDYQYGEFQNWGMVKLNHGPILQVLEYAVCYPDSGSYIPLPLEWVQTDVEGLTNVLNIIPGVGSVGSYIIGWGNSILPLTFTSASYLPDLFKISYTAGFPPNKVPEIFLQIIGMQAAIQVMTQVSNSFIINGAIEQQISIDSVTERVTTIPFLFEKQIELYRKQIKENVSTLRSYYRGLNMVVA